MPKIKKAISKLNKKSPNYLKKRVKIINSIETLFKNMRQQSKGATFALQFLGTIYTLMRQFGFSRKAAQEIYDNFHEEFRETDEYIERRLDSAYDKGYVRLAFGTMLRTPHMHKAIRGHLSKQASQERRTVVNALGGQSYGSLNTRATQAILKRVWASPYRYQIIPINEIHDANYWYVKQLKGKKKYDALNWLNNVLREEMAWQELPEIQHDKVTLGGTPEIYHPTWANPIKIPKNGVNGKIKKILSK